MKHTVELIVSREIEVPEEHDEELADMALDKAVAALVKEQENAGWSTTVNTVDDEEYEFVGEEEEEEEEEEETSDEEDEDDEDSEDDSEDDEEE